MKGCVDPLKLPTAIPHPNNLKVNVMTWHCIFLSTTRRTYHRSISYHSCLRMNYAEPNSRLNPTSYCIKVALEYHMTFYFNFLLSKMRQLPEWDINKGVGRFSLCILASSAIRQGAPRSLTDDMYDATWFFSLVLLPFWRKLLDLWTQLLLILLGCF
jgi:hypothetical protein